MDDYEDAMNRDEDFSRIQQLQIENAALRLANKSLPAHIEKLEGKLSHIREWALATSHGIAAAEVIKILETEERDA